MTQKKFTLSGVEGRSRRKPGGQPDNQNARTHGFYSKTLTTEQQESLLAARELDGLDQEIALVRLKIASILANDPQNYRVLMLALTSLARLLQTKHLLAGHDRQKLVEAFKIVLRDIAAPLGFTLSKFKEPVLSPPKEPVLSPSKEIVFRSFTKDESRST